MVRSIWKVLLTASIVGAAMLAPAAASADGTFNCSASAIRLSVLGQTAIEPVTANSGASSCQSAIGTLAGVPQGLPAPLSASIAGAQTSLSGPAGAVYQQTASATGAIGDLAIKSLPSLPIALPAPQIPAGLDAVSVPLSSTLTTAIQLATGLNLSSITVNLLPAVQALLPTQALPNVDLADVHIASSTASAACINGAPQMSGSSQVVGVSALGQSLPVDQVVNQAVTLINAQSISLSNINLGLVSLPSGLSFSNPIYGSALQAAVQSVVNGLAPVTIPATVGQVSVTPAQQTNSNGTLTQRALEVSASILGHSVADVVLGEASVSDSGVSCAPPAVAAPAPASTLALQCTSRKLNLINVIDSGHHVSLLGAADRSLIGKSVEIIFSATGQRVASAIVRPDGFFRASVPLPPRSIRHTNAARYVAVFGAERSLDLKLDRRMHISALHHRGRNVVISGVVSGPLASHEILIQRRVSCTQLVTVARVHPRSDGTWTATVPAPPNEQAAVYRAATQVLNNPNSSKKFPTFTLPGFVSL